jgi:serine/threonine protein phosphatase PrpC
MRIAACGVSDAGTVRSNNEDAYAFVDLTSGQVVDIDASQKVLEVGARGALIVVSDGMGGEKAGEVAAALVIEGMREHLARARQGEGEAGEQGDAAALLCGAVLHANARVLEAAKVEGREGMGATVTAVLVQGTNAYTAEVGDSRAYVLRQGELVQITKDQTYIQVLIDRGAMPLEQIMKSTAKNVILQAIGKAPELVVAQRRLALRQGDGILVCSDGLHGQVQEKEIRDMLLLTDSFEEATARLAVAANQAGGKDNVTIVLVAIDDDSLPVKSPGEDVGSTLEAIRQFSVGG